MKYLNPGGWTYSPSFHPIVISPAHRARFVQSSVKLLEDYGLDGLDIDYEYPQNDAQARGYVDLLRELRHGLDEHQREKGIDYKFLLTVCSFYLHNVNAHIKELDRSTLRTR
jgi:chitinase